MTPTENALPPLSSANLGRAAIRARLRRIEELRRTQRRASRG